MERERNVEDYERMRQEIKERNESRKMFGQKQNVLHKDFNPSSTYPRSSGSWKWRFILAPIWTKLQDEKTGNGLIIKNSGYVWKVKKHSGKGFRKLHDGTYYKKGHMIYKL